MRKRIVIALGGNAVVNFQYGQKSSGWFKSMLLSLDDNIKWHGSGMAAIIPEDVKMQILEKLNKAQRIYCLQMLCKSKG